MNEFVETLLDLPWHDPADTKRTYDVVIIGGGGHGLATAHYLATNHGITNVLVVERSYIGAGNSGRNTTIIRANYGIPESVRFYQRSLSLYETLEADTGCWIMHSTKGIMWLAHTESSMRAERARALLNTACGTDTVMIDDKEAKRLCPQLDMSGGGRYPIRGGSYHSGGASARHDRVVWAFAQSAMRHGVHVLQNTEVIGLTKDENGRVTGVVTPNGTISAGIVMSAVGGRATTVANMAGARLPIRTHPLQAFVTNAYAQGLGPIVSSTELLAYVSQTARGQMLMGAEFDAQPTYSTQTSFEILQSVATKLSYLLPFLRNLRIMRQWTGICDISPDFSPIMGATDVDGFCISTGWGTWGFKAIPAGGEQMAAYIANGRSTSLIAPFGLSRFAADHPMADQGSSGTR
jgi:sarcosine oxidase, subunit beta